MRTKIWSAEDGSCPVTFTGHTAAVTHTGQSLSENEFHACAKGGGGARAPQILANQKAPPAAVARRLTLCPPQIFRLWHTPEFNLNP